MKSGVTHVGIPWSVSRSWVGGKPSGRPEAGQTLFIPAMLVAVVVIVALAVAHLGAVVSDRAQARTAADAAALAAVMAGPDAARSVAAANGATLDSVTVTQHAAHVSVRVGRATAAAKAGTTSDGTGAAVPGGPAGDP